MGVFCLMGSKGEDMIRPVDLKTHFNNPFFMKPSDDFDKIMMISSDTNGKTFFVYLSGKVEIQRLGKWSSAMFFDYIDINNDGIKEMAFAENKNIAFFTTEGKPLLSIMLDNPITDRPMYINIKGKNYLSYLNRETQNAFMVDYEGNIYRNWHSQAKE